MARNVTEKLWLPLFLWVTKAFGGGVTGNYCCLFTFIPTFTGTLGICSRLSLRVTHNAKLVVEITSCVQPLTPLNCRDSLRLPYGSSFCYFVSKSYTGSKMP